MIPWRLWCVRVIVLCMPARFGDGYGQPTSGYSHAVPQNPVGVISPGLGYPRNTPLVSNLSNFQKSSKFVKSRAVSPKRPKNPQKPFFWIKRPKIEQVADKIFGTPQKLGQNWLISTCVKMCISALTKRPRRDRPTARRA